MKAGFSHNHFVYMVMFLCALCIVKSLCRSTLAYGLEAHLSYSGVDGFTCDASSLIDHLSCALPGDEDHASILLSNESDLPLTITLATTGDHDLNRQESNSLLEQVSMTLKDDGQILYEGPLEGSGLAQGVFLAQMAPQSTKTIECEIAVPSGLTNEQALAGVTSELLVSAQQDALEAEGEIPKTGEGSTFVPLCLGLICFVASLASLVGLTTRGRTRYE